MSPWIHIFVAICLSLPAFGEEHTARVRELEPKLLEDPEQRLPFWSFILDIPATLVNGTKEQFKKDALPGWGVMLGSSAILYHYDDDILRDVQAKGRSWHLGNSVNYKSVLEVGNTTIYAAPTDTAGWLYFLGDGTIPIVVAGSLVGTGYFKKRNRLHNTGIEMLTGLLSGSLVDQAIKRSTGRESPSKATEPRGRWQPFPNFKAYGSNTAKYDAMPSGHIMSATVMFTVLQEEYPEYNYIWYPTEVVWLGILGFGMVNVGVHWASDYPLGIAVGYVFGRAAVRIHHPDRYKNASQWHFLPSVDSFTGTPMMNALYRW